MLLLIPVQFKGVVYSFFSGWGGHYILFFFFLGGSLHPSIRVEWVRDSNTASDVKKAKYGLSGLNYLRR